MEACPACNRSPKVEIVKNGSTYISCKCGYGLSAIGTDRSAAERSWNHKTREAKRQYDSRCVRR